MYNRYLRNDDGSYTRIPEEETPRRPSQNQPPTGREPQGEQGRRNPSGPGGGQDSRDGRAKEGHDHFDQDRQEDRHSGTHSDGGFWESGPFDPPPSFGGDRGDGLTGFLRHFLDRWHLDSVDTGDLLLLGLLFVLFREDADEELLVALGLLLIL